MIDRHHLTMALHEEGVEEVPISIVENISALNFDEFWATLENRNWTHPYDDEGFRCAFERMPTSIIGLVDDPFRSLAGALKRTGGYAKNKAPFSEFRWADFLRIRIDRKLVERDFGRALAIAMNLAGSEEAAELPGWLRHPEHQARRSLYLWVIVSNAPIMKASCLVVGDGGPVAMRRGGTLMTTTGTKSTTDALQTFSTAANEAAHAVQDCCSTALKGMQDYSGKVAEFTQANIQSHVEFVQKLAGVKSPSEFIEMSASHTRHQLETLAEQGKELAALAQQVTRDAAEPLKTGFMKAPIAPR